MSELNLVYLVKNTNFNPGGGYRGEQSGFFSLRSWRSHLFCMEITLSGIPGSGMHK